MAEYAELFGGAVWVIEPLHSHWECDGPSLFPEHGFIPNLPRSINFPLGILRTQCVFDLCTLTLRLVFLWKSYIL
ncbi:MAG: hypothetical protein AAFP20_19900, partial [Cyanobacteria bacterium J06614_10]